MTQELTYGRFLLDMRSGRVMENLSVWPGYENWQPARKIKRDKNWSIPSYDFGYLIDPQSPDYIGDRVDGLVNEIGTLSGDDLDIGPGQLPINPNGLVTVTSHKAATLEHECAFLFNYAGKRHVLTYRPSTHFMDGNERKGVRCEFYRFENGRFRLIVGESAWLHKMATTASTLLANPNIIYEMGEFDSDMSVLNKRRRAQGLKRVPATQIIRLTRVEKIGGAEQARVDQGGTHASPRPHNRAPNGYHRTYKRTGLTKWYPGPIKVRGGADAVEALEYEVRP